MNRTGECAHDVREEILILSLFLLTVHLSQVLLFEGISQFLFDFLFTLFGWLNESHKEHWWYAESQDAFNECSHDFQVDQSLEQFLEVVEALGEKSFVAVSQLVLQSGFQFLVGSVLVAIKFKLLGLESVLLEKSDVVRSHVCHAGYTEKLVALDVFVAKILVTFRNNPSKL